MSEQPGVGPESQRLYRRAMEAVSEDPALAGHITLRRLEQGRPEDAEARAEVEAFQERYLERTVDAMIAELGPNVSNEEMHRWLEGWAEREKQRRAREDGSA